MWLWFFCVCIFASDTLLQLFDPLSPLLLFGPVLCYKWRCWEGQNIKGRAADRQIHRDTPSELPHTSSGCVLGPSLILWEPVHRDGAAVSQIPFTSRLFSGELTVLSLFQGFHMYLRHVFDGPGDHLVFECMKWCKWTKTYWKISICDWIYKLHLWARCCLILFLTEEPCLLNIMWHNYLDYALWQSGHCARHYMTEEQIMCAQRHPSGKMRWTPMVWSKDSVTTPDFRVQIKNIINSGVKSRVTNQPQCFSLYLKMTQGSDVHSEHAGQTSRGKLSKRQWGR